MDNIGQRLKEERQLKGWSQRDLARETGVNTDTISGIETGQHEPRPSTLRKLAEGLSIEVRDLFMEPTLPKAPAREAGQPEGVTTAPGVIREAEETGIRAKNLEDAQRFIQEMQEFPEHMRGKRLSLEIGDDNSVVMQLKPVSPAAERSTRKTRTRR